MAHGSWLLRSGSRVCFVLQGFHYCAMYYRQSQPNFEWNKTRSKDTLPYLTKILTITSIVACQLSYNVEYICWRNFTQKNNHCIRIHTQAHTHSEPTDLSRRNCFMYIVKKSIVYLENNIISFSASAYSQDTIWPFSHLFVTDVLGWYCVVNFNCMCH